MNRKRSIVACFVAIALGPILGCHAPKSSTQKPAAAAVAPVIYRTLGTIERLEPGFDAIIAPASSLEILAEGFDWSEGPVWMKTKGSKGGQIVFSDVPANIVYRWKEGEGISEFLKPSGYTGSTPRGGEPGSNGLALDAQGRLILCQHGDRKVARLERDGRFTTLAEFYKFRRFNSPNDLAFKSNGDLYFTDPPYGLEKLNDDPKKELLSNGVYRLSPQGEVTRLTGDLTFPNGIAFAPDEKTLYVAVSDPRKPYVMAYDVTNTGLLENGRIFFDASPLMAGRKGLPDGLKLDKAGNLFCTGPGGVLVISPEGKHLGTINTGEATANCGWGDDGTVLYVTADMYLCRIKTLTAGAQLKASKPAPSAKPKTNKQGK